MKPFLILLALIFPGLSFAQQTQHHYKVVRVIDGDTFDATDGVIEFRVRIAGIDAPEKAQGYGKVASFKLKEAIEAKNIRLQPVKDRKDGYNRILAQVFLDDLDVGQFLIQEGLATYYRPTCKNFPEDENRYNYDAKPYVEAEQNAKSRKRGLWRFGDQQLPCKFRKEHRR